MFKFGDKVKLRSLSGKSFLGIIEDVLAGDAGEKLYIVILLASPGGRGVLCYPEELTLITEEQ